MDNVTENDTALVSISDPISAAEEARWSRQFIYKIPPCFLAPNEGAYKPQMVSIGPYHHGFESFQAMEVHKLRARCHLLNRSGKSLEFLYLELSPIVQDLKDAYDQLDETRWQSTESFLELMITDGCFILELLNPSTEQSNQASIYGYPENDPIFSKHGKRNIVPYLRRDMLLLENQIPMVVLHKLFSAIRPKEHINKLTIDILTFWCQEKENQKLNELSKCLHILDLYRRSLIFEPKKSSRWKSMDCCPKIKDCCTKKSQDDKIIRSATDLKDAGIRIEKSKTESLKDISFTRVLFGLCGGVLKLPLIVVDDTFESSYLNMMAYERFHAGAGSEVTSYVIFMDSIINNVHDVSLLHSGRVLQNALGSDEAVAKLFNSISTNSVLDMDDHLGKVHKDVSIYCEKEWHRWRGYFFRQYCANPWISVTVLAAVFIFALTVVQTVYAVMSYHKQFPNSRKKFN